MAAFTPEERTARAKIAAHTRWERHRKRKLAEAQQYAVTADAELAAAREALEAAKANRETPEPAGGPRDA